MVICCSFMFISVNTDTRNIPYEAVSQNFTSCFHRNQVILLISAVHEDIHIMGNKIVKD